MKTLWVAEEMTFKLKPEGCISISPENIGEQVVLAEETIFLILRQERIHHSRLLCQVYGVWFKQSSLTDLSLVFPVLTVHAD